MCCQHWLHSWQVSLTMTINVHSNLSVVNTNHTCRQQSVCYVSLFTLTIHADNSLCVVLLLCVVLSVVLLLFTLTIHIDGHFSALPVVVCCVVVVCCCVVVVHTHHTHWWSLQCAACCCSRSWGRLPGQPHRSHTPPSLPWWRCESPAPLLSRRTCGSLLPYVHGPITPGWCDPERHAPDAIITSCGVTTRACTLVWENVREEKYATSPSQDHFEL